MKNVVCLCVVLLFCHACVSEPSAPLASTPDVPVYSGPEDDGDDNDSPLANLPDDMDPSPAAAYYEIAFIDRDGPTFTDPADANIVPSANFVIIVRTDDGTVRRATDEIMGAEHVRFVPLADPAEPGPGDGNAAIYDVLPALAGHGATGAVALTDLDPALGNSMTPLLSLAVPDSFDIDPAGDRLISCGVNYSPCICCGMRAKAKLLSLTGGAETALEDALNEALAMQLMTGSTECQFGMDGNVLYASGKGMDGNPLLVRAMLDPGAVMVEPVPEAGSQGWMGFDVSPDGMKIVFINPLSGEGAITVRDLGGEMMPFTLSEPGGDAGEDFLAVTRHRSPRWCDDTHVAWQTFDGSRRTVYLADTMTRERVDVWSDDNRVPLSESSLDCRPRQE